MVAFNTFPIVIQIGGQGILTYYSVFAFHYVSNYPLLLKTYNRQFLYGDFCVKSW